MDFVDTPRNCEAGISIILFFPAVPLRSLMELLSRLELPNLFITNEVLYLLSYSSILYPTGFNPWGVATEKGLEPSASSVTG